MLRELILSVLTTHKKDNCEAVMDVLISLTMVTISQCTHVLNDIVHLKYVQFLFVMSKAGKKNLIFVKVFVADIVLIFISSSFHM